MAAFLVLMGVLCCAWGLMFIFAKDMAWACTEWSNSLRGLASERTDRWDSVSTIQGVGTVILGLVIFCSIPGLVPRPAAAPPASGVSTLTVDGHPATPEQRREFERQFGPGGAGGPAGSGGH